ncbi:MAG: SufE family protein [Bacteroidia bacterium]|jgi:cysteine desulfuration protein SufE
MTIDEIQNEIIEDFNLFSDWTEKYEYLIEQGKYLQAIDEKYKTDEYVIKGCQSKVWLRSELKDDKIVFFADSDAVITKGIIGLLIKVLNNQSPENIYNSKLFFIENTGLQEHLSPTRANGLVSMIKQMKMDSLALSKKNQ